jgi:cytochrome c biogenesis protein CcdA
MKYLSSLLIVLLSILGLHAQILEPVTWATQSEALGNDELLLTFTATMDPGWSIYSQFTSDEGPVPTSFFFDEADHYERIGQVAEKGKKKEGPDELFGGVIVIKFPEGPVVFTQKIKVKEYGKPVTGYLEFMTCDDERCLPPTEIDFSFELTPPDAERSGAVDAPKAATEPTATAVATAEPTPTNAETTSQKQETSTSDADVLATARAQQVKDVAEGLLQPVLWSIQAEQMGAERYQLTFTAEMEEGWSIYSQFTDDNGPVPTTFYFEGEGYERIGKMEESGKAKKGPDPLFGGVTVIKYPHGPVTFTQQVLAKGADQISGVVEFMTCDEEQCLPPTEVPFLVKLSPLAVQIGDQPTAPTSDEGALGGTVLEAGMPYPLDKSIVEAEPAGLCGEEEVSAEKKSIWSILGLGFLGGLVALITPCVFPMMPLTVSFFTKTATTRRKGIVDASLYGLFILLVYLLLSIPFHLMDSIDPDILNSISTSVPLNIIFFVVFVAFAISFFGYFELTVPESWTNKASQAEGSGGYIGIFFMALTLALVSFSCTGPILGSLLVGALSADGGAWQLTAGMGGFGLGLALPFGLFAGFPGIMKALTPFRRLVEQRKGRTGFPRAGAGA